MFGDQDDNHFTTSDLDKISQLKADHVMNAVRVCPDLANRNVFGLQVSYTRFTEDGRITDEVFLESHGFVEDSAIVYCQTIDLLGGEYIAFSGLSYTENDLVQYFYSTNEGNTNAYGQGTKSTISADVIQYSPDEITFFGYKGRISSSGQLSGLSLIGYDTSCVEQFKQELGDDFVWFTPEPEEEESTDGEGEENEGEGENVGERG